MPALSARAKAPQPQDLSRQPSNLETSLGLGFIPGNAKKGEKGRDQGAS
jgi:hypothetical protein